MTRPLKIFISHAVEDKPEVHKVYEFLRSCGADPWLDDEKLVPGQDWKLEVSKALDDSDVILICLTNRTVSKEGYVQKEIRVALDRALEMPEGGIILIPARLEECEIPFQLKPYQWVDLYADGGMKKLIRSFNFRAEQVGANLLSEGSGPPPEIKPSKRNADDSKTSGGNVINIHGNVTGSNIILGDNNEVKK